MKRLTFFPLGLLVPTGISIQEMPTAGRGHSARSRGRPKGSGSTAKGAGKGRSRKSTAGSAAAMAGAKAGAAAASAAAYAAYGYNVSKGTRPSEAAGFILVRDSLESLLSILLGRADRTPPDQEAPSQSPCWVLLLHEAVLPATPPLSLRLSEYTSAFKV